MPPPPVPAGKKSKSPLLPLVFPPKTTKPADPRFDARPFALLQLRRVPDELLVLIDVTCREFEALVSLGGGMSTRL